MKKATWLLGAAAAALLASGAPLTIKAVGPGTSESDNITSTDAGFVLEDDSETAVANSVAQFSIEAGKLSLKAVPSLHFQNAQVKALIAGPVTLNLDDNAVTPDADGYDGNNSKQIQVLDYRGTNKGWNLTAKLSNFVGSGGDLTATTLVLAGNATGDNYTGSLGTGNFASDAASILSAAEQQGGGQTTGTVASASLTLPQTLKPSSGDYRATITWTLEATPVPNSSNGQ